jgi:uncharacterized protein YjbJ (UPF0337 family)
MDARGPGAIPARFSFVRRLRSTQRNIDRPATCAVTHCNSGVQIHAIAHSATRGTPPDSLPPKRIQRMNKDIIAGKWTQIKGQAQQKWGKLTDDVFDTQQGDSKYLAGKLQEQYGWDRDRAETEVRDFERTLNS